MITLFAVAGVVTLALVGLVSNGLVAALWYWFPAWVPRRLTPVGGLCC